MAGAEGSARAGGAPGVGSADEWFLAEAPSEAENAWDTAHAAAAEIDARLGLAGEITYVEPDLEQQFPAFEEPETGFAVTRRKGRPDPRGPGFARHLRHDFSELQLERGAADPGSGVLENPGHGTGTLVWSL